PAVVLERVGASRARQLGAFVTDVVVTSEASSAVVMSAGVAEALAALRAWNYENIYLRPESVAQAGMVHRMLRALVEHYVSHPWAEPAAFGLGEDDALRAAVAYVAGMTDRFACAQAARLVNWPKSEMPEGFDVAEPA
ncbi:MAG TPA: deoxyguanosinetriphosphate triphosphohydrolase, partial [Acidimicrobiales bacterium]|nr:deoxyguanosinetriphosphate triphosphohydrolase [Acidimicrobiales bacterium]